MGGKAISFASFREGKKIVKTGRGAIRKRVFKLCGLLGSPLLLYSAVRISLTKIHAFHVT
jgi:hypothetical protein